MDEIDGASGPAVSVEERARSLVQGGDLSWAAAVLAAGRDLILDRWLAVAADQPFHRGRRDHAVADDIPALLDAVIALLERNAPPWVEPTAPLDDPAVVVTARRHARARAHQGLQPAEIVIEFRLLRQEIWRALQESPAPLGPAADLLDATLFVYDALDGAITLALAALTTQIDEAREEFLATTLHDVRHPLTVISASAQLIERLMDREPTDQQRLATHLRRILEAAGRMEAQLTTLVEAARVTLGQLDLRPGTVDLAELTRERIAHLAPADAARIGLQPAPPASARLEGDPVWLGRVVDNLLSNAVKFSPTGAPVVVEVTGDQETVTLCVRDAGMGISEDDLPRLFRRYARGAEAVTAGIEGTGLGLYLCRGVVEAHGGRIWAESAGLGQGTTMRVVLPRRPGGDMPAHPRP
jgi:signal transduction histidine kinase